jgi:transcriptional regulator with PAS, ATPase and Fis domain
MDEICEMPLPLQSKLLRTIQDKQLRHVGGNELIQVDVRIISATNKNMHEALTNGSFREDLYYRLNVINIHLPPLRERKGDIRLLAEHFLEKIQKLSPTKISGFSQKVFETFENYDWPGNIRELENVVERAATLAKSDMITYEELPKQMTGNDISSFSFQSLNLADAKQKMIYELEKKYLVYLLEKYNGHVTKMADEAGMTRRNIHRLLNLHGFDPETWRTKSCSN